MPNIQNMSLDNNPWSTTVIGVMIEVIPNTANRLKIFEPIKLPTEMAFSFLITAITDAANSGILVPTDTTVIPITRSLTPKDEASPTAPSISNSETAPKGSTAQSQEQGCFVEGQRYIVLGRIIHHGCFLKTKQIH